MVRTRFAPSPTGFLHIGGARTALFAWAYARRHGGTFILRIEDTDLARSTPEAVQAILDGMVWLGLPADEGPFYQTRRMDRYRAVLSDLVARGLAYPCYMAPEDLDALRDAQRARGEKPRYDGRWRPEPGKKLPQPPANVKPVIRFRNPVDGTVVWEDQVKGRIEFANNELDDLVIARPDGTPTYNFCVCVDDWDMQITHVIRGDDHVNNTPRQINILRALGAEVPKYAHLSMILGDDGQKLSKRHGAVSVMQYDEEGYLPEAVINYLARLGWSHGDDEIFSREQFVEWFDLDKITPSAAQFNTDKLRWLNQHYMKSLPLPDLTERVRNRLVAREVSLIDGPDLSAAVSLYLDRCNTLEALADSVAVFYSRVAPNPDVLQPHLTATTEAALQVFAEAANTARDWSAPAIATLIKTTIGAHSLKMPQLAMPLRIIMTGQAQTPAVDAVLALFPATTVSTRIGIALAQAKKI